MSDDVVAVTYVGPHDETTLGGVDPDYDTSELPAVVARGETVEVPGWLADGWPAQPGVYELDGKRVEFDGLVVLPDGAAVTEWPKSARGGLLAPHRAGQPDAPWVPAKQPKIPKAKAEGDTEGGD